MCHSFFIIISSAFHNKWTWPHGISHCMILHRISGAQRRIERIAISINFLLFAGCWRTRFFGLLSRASHCEIVWIDYLFQTKWIVQPADGGRINKATIDEKDVDGNDKRRQETTTMTGETTRQREKFNWNDNPSNKWMVYRTVTWVVRAVACCVVSQSSVDAHTPSPVPWPKHLFSFP